MSILPFYFRNFQGSTASWLNWDLKQDSFTVLLLMIKFDLKLGSNLFSVHADSLRYISETYP